MAQKYKTRAIVFKKKDRNESDRIFSVFTDDFGRLDIFAKAIRKSVSKLRSGIDTFFVSEIEFIQGKSRKTLTDAIACKKFDCIYGDAKKFKVANKVGEVLDNFLRGEEKDEKIFNLVNDTFITLDNSKSESQNLRLSYYYFLWNFLSLLGYHSQAQKCAGCHQELIQSDVYFSSKEGGVVCKKCSLQDIYAKKINPDIVKMLRLILKKDWQVLSKLKIDLASQKLFGEISDNYRDYILSKSVSRVS